MTGLKSYRNLPLYWQLLAPMLLVITLWFGNTVHALMGLEEAQTRLKGLYADEVHTVIAVEQLQMRITRMHLSLLKHLTSESATKMAQLEMSLDTNTQKLQKMLLDLEYTVSNTHPAHEINLEKMRNAYQWYLTSLARVLDLSADFEKEQALRLLEDETGPALEAVNQQTMNLAHLEEGHMAGGFEEALNLEQDSFFTTFVVSIFMALLSWLIIWLTSRSTSMRLSQLVGSAESLGQGNLNTRIESDTQDEIGRLGQSLNTMAIKLEEAMTEEHLASVAVQQANQKLRMAQDRLEERVKTRTESLTQSEQRLLSEVTIRSALNTLLERSFSANTIQELMEVCLETLLAQPFLGLAHQGGFFLIHPEKRHLELRCAVDFPQPLTDMCRMDEEQPCICHKVLSDGKVRFDRLQQPLRSDETSDILEFYAVPVLVEGGMSGVIILMAEQHGANRIETIDFLQSTARVIATALKRLSLQSLMLQQEKLVSLGEMVAGVAHEVNTPVGIGVTASSELADTTRQFKQLLQKEGISQEELEDYLNTVDGFSRLIQESMQRAATLVRSFKMVSVDQSSEERRHFKLKQHIEAVTTSLQHQLKSAQVQIQLTCPEQLELNSFPGAYAQIFTNLIQNSIVHGFVQQTNQSGLIDIEISQQGMMLQLLYRDNGCGIDPIARQKIFEPFFTTQRNRGGSGLGMHIVFNLITGRLEGTIVCEEPTTHGAQFRINLPLLETPPLSD
ncbi:sensor histidine kinase [Magnetococcus sp. PR-3]|uniref:sensor histidine kinase n=1 Tax=Magnetococcus sp. PR-3 TaxID=3120355 RepID=UPI002FCE0270